MMVMIPSVRPLCHGASTKEQTLQFSLGAEKVMGPSKAPCAAVKMKSPPKISSESRQLENVVTPGFLDHEHWVLSLDLNHHFVLTHISLALREIEASKLFHFGRQRYVC